MSENFVMEVANHHNHKSERKTEEGKMTTGSGSIEMTSDFVQSASEKCEQKV